MGRSVSSRVWVDTTVRPSEKKLRVIGDATCTPPGTREGLSQHPGNMAAVGSVGRLTPQVDYRASVGHTEQEWPSPSAPPTCDNLSLAEGRIISREAMGRGPPCTLCVLAERLDCRADCLRPSAFCRHDDCH